MEINLSEISPEEAAIRRRILDWAGPSFPLDVRDEAVRVYSDYSRSRQTDEVDYYTSELVFGTGGLRGVIGNGPGRMNPWTVGRATLGFCRFLEKRNTANILAVAHDSRRMSPEFARVTAGIAASLGFQVYLFDTPTPTPILSYAIRELKATGGVVITASHNPPEYNGYKVFLEDGAQMVEEQEEVESCIESVRDWAEIPFLDPEDPLYKKRVMVVGENIRESYYKRFESIHYRSSRDSINRKELKIVYSPLHGTGVPWLPGLLEQAGFQVALVEEQSRPDGEFPTVKYPNPEEPDAMRLAEEKARSIDAHLFLATDPDADRLGAGFRRSTGEYLLLNGNQIGSIMCAYLAERHSGKRGKGGTLSGRPWIFKTVVTTDLQREIAKANGVSILEVLTGFKYIAEQMRKIDRLEKPFEKGDRFLFGGEESFGYLPVEFVRDKDSLSSALLLCEILSEVGDIPAYLDEIYLNYGLYLEVLKSVTLKGSSGQKRIQEVIENLRKEDLTGWKLGQRSVKAVLDFREQTRNGVSSPDDFVDLPRSNVLQLELEPEGKLTIRPSGTEPKVKLYASLKHPIHPSSPEELESCKKELQDELVSLTGIFFAKTGLVG